MPFITQDKTNLKYILIVVILAAIVGGGLYFLFSSDWWIYRNWWTYQDPYFGYKIKFPADWIEAEGNEYQKEIKQFQPKEVDITKAVMVTIITQSGSSEFFSEYRKLQESEPGETVFQDVNINKLQNFNLDGCNAVQYYAHQIEYGYNPKYVTVCAGNNRFIKVRITAKTKEDLDSYKELYKKMLFSFKFNEYDLSKSYEIPPLYEVSPPPPESPTLEPIPNSNWQTYTNPKYGYSINVPLNWKEKGTSPIIKKFTRKDNEAIELGIDVHDYSSSEIIETYEALKNLGANETYVLSGGQEVKKIQNINLDGCVAPLFYGVDTDNGHAYMVLCVGNKGFLIIGLSAPTKNDLEFNKPTYDQVLDSFRFNEYNL